MVGFVEIKKDATTCKGAMSPAEFKGKACMVMEFAKDGGALVLNPAGSALAMFDACDIYRKFECGFMGDVITPPGLSFAEQARYAIKVITRKGGYTGTLKYMVISASLAKGVFYDKFLWSMQ